eukprot:scaffold89008_cov49-Cyclotella_meneghiniana.AAC.1
MKIALVSILNLALIATASATKGSGKMSDESLPAVAPMKHGVRAAAGTKTHWTVHPGDVEWCGVCSNADFCSFGAATGELEPQDYDTYLQNQCFYKLRECCGKGA